MNVSSRCRGDAFLECFGITAGFEEISDAALNDNTWTVVASQPWKRPPSHITLMEAMTRTFNVRHIARAAHNHGLKHLLCGDNMSTICMGTKGRASDHDMLVEARKVCAVSLAANLTIVDRWIPTRKNVSDAASRKFAGAIQDLSGQRRKASNRFANPDGQLQKLVTSKDSPDKGDPTDQELVTSKDSPNKSNPTDVRISYGGGASIHCMTCGYCRLPILQIELRTPPTNCIS